MDIEQSGVSKSRFRVALLMVTLLAGIGWLIQLPCLIFGKEVVLSLLTALLFTGQCVLVIITILRRVAENRRQLLSNLLLRSGVFLTLLGLLGGCLLLLLPYTGINDTTALVSIASLLLMVGLTLGIPLVVTTMYEEDHQKRLIAAINSEQPTDYPT